MFLMLPGVGPKKYNAWKDKITYLTFLRVCQMDSAGKVFINEYNIKVPESVIDYCKGVMMWEEVERRRRENNETYDRLKSKYGFDNDRAIRDNDRKLRK